LDVGTTRIGEGGKMCPKKIIVERTTKKVKQNSRKEGPK